MGEAGLSPPVGFAAKDSGLAPPQGCPSPLPLPGPGWGEAAEAGGSQEEGPAQQRCFGAGHRAKAGAVRGAARVQSPLSSDSLEAWPRLRNDTGVGEAG